VKVAIPVNVIECCNKHRKNEFGDFTTATYDWFRDRP